MVNSQSIVLQIYIILVFFTVLKPNIGYAGLRKYTKDDLVKLREEVREMFNHAYSGYLKYAYPYDELRPLTCDGVDTWGSYSLTLIDALDTLAVMGNYSEFRRVVDIVTSKANFDANINVSVFETNIRIVGGLLSAHMLSQRAGVELEPGWPCNGPLLRLAEDVARRLLAAFDTATGMPYGTVNLRHGVPPGETAVTCAAGVGTFVLEFAALSRLTGDPVYEEVALNALHALYHHRSSIGLYGNHIDVMSGRWTAQDSGIGAGVDSFFEYLVKGALLTQRPELMVMFHEARASIDKYLKRNDWYLWASMHKGQVTLPVFQSLEAYWPGVLSLIGDISAALKSMHNYHQVWKQYGFTPEFYNIPQGQVGANRESYPLRPELIESAMYLYRATGDPFLLDVGTDILRSIQHSARTKCGYATIKDCRDHSLENRMESFFLAETTKYLYLLFDTDNFIHNDGGRGLIHTLPSGRQCILDAGGYIFNTEAHPLDPGTLKCCSDNFEDKKHYNRRKTHGVKLNSFVKSSEEHKSSPDNPQADDSVQTLNPPSTLNEEALQKENAEKVDDIIIDDNVGERNNVDISHDKNLSEEKIQSSRLYKSVLTPEKLVMMDTLINSNLQNPLIKTTWSRDLLEELVNVIENAEEMMLKSKNSVNNRRESELIEKSTQNLVQNGEPFKNGDSVSTVDKDVNKPEEISEDGKIIVSDVKSLPLSSQNVEPDLNLLKGDRDREKKKGKKLFDVIITQQFNTIKSTISVEADIIMLHVHKSLENINLTKDLIDVAIEHELETRFFTKRLKVTEIAMQLTADVKKTRKFLGTGELEDTITLEFFKALVGSVVDGKSVMRFLDDYKSYLELSKTLIDLEKGKHHHFDTENPASNEDGILHDYDNNSKDNDKIEQIRENNVLNSEVQNSNWKTDSISYEVDDGDRVTPVTKVDSGQPLFSEKVTTSPVDDLIGYLSKSLVPNETPFNPQHLLERIRLNQRYPRNETWMTKYELLTCLPQPYFTRITLSGEFFDES